MRWGAQPRIPRQFAPGRDRNRVEPAARLTDELAAVIAGARRRALRDGDRQIDTARLLHTLLESDPEVCAVFGGGPQVARLLGYLVQRSIGYGLRRQSGIEDSGAVPGLVLVGVAGWSPLVAEVMEGACGRAERRGAERACGVDLLAAIVAAPASRAAEVLGRAGVDREELWERIRSGARTGPAGAGAAGGVTR